MTSTTVTATLSSSQSSAVTVTLPASGAYTLGDNPLTIAVGDTTKTTTLTAVNDYLPVSVKGMDNNALNLSLGASVSPAPALYGYGVLTSSPATTVTINPRPYNNRTSSPSPPA